MSRGDNLLSPDYRTYSRNKHGLAGSFILALASFNRKAIMEEFMEELKSKTVPISMGYSVDHVSVMSSDSSYPYGRFKILPSDLISVPDGGGLPDRTAQYAKEDAYITHFYYNATKRHHTAFVAMWSAYRDAAVNYEGYKDALDIVLEEQYTEPELWLVMPQDIRNSYTEKAVGFFGEKSGWSSYGDD